MKAGLVSTFFALTMLLVGYGHAAEPLTAQVNPKLLGTSSFNKWGLPLKTGQIVVTESPEPINTIYMLLYPQFSPFIHVGILELEDDQAYVYESSGEYKLGLDNKPPTDHVEGYVRRIPLTQYISEYGETVSFYQPPNADLSKVLQQAKQHADAKTPFDAYFNYTDRSRLYCSEFVAHAFEAGGAPAYRTVPMQLNASMQTIVSWLKVKDRAILPVEQLIAHSNWVGTISTKYTLTELKADRAVKAQLYQRFTSNQKLGNILAWGGTSVSFQPAVANFKQQALTAFDKNQTYSAAQVASKVSELADQYLGKFEIRNIALCKLDFSLCH